jgi:DNA-binding protein YbaB
VEPGTGADALLARLRVTSAKLAERAEVAQAELAAVKAVVRSRDGVATVTVGAGGVMRGLQLTTNGARASDAQVSRSVMTAYQQGCRQVAEQAAAIMARHAPGSPAVAMMRDAIPPDPDEENPEERR